MHHVNVTQGRRHVTHIKPINAAEYLLGERRLCVPREVCKSVYLGVQPCFGVVYHELTTLRRVYFAKPALAARAK